MKYFILIISFSFISVLPSIGQNSDYSLGIRLGGSSGFTAKWHLTEYVAGEGLLSFRHGGFQVTGLVEFQQPGLSEFLDGINWYYGLGAHIGYYSGHRHYYEDHHSRRHGGGLSLGPDAIAGLVYQLDRLPLSVSIDYKPYIDILRFRHFFEGFDDFALSVRYVF